MPKPVSCHWTNGKALPGWNKSFYLMETDEKALYLAAWYLIRPHWVFKICLRLLSPWLGVLFSFWNLWGNIFSAVGRYSTKVCNINCGWFVFYRTFWVLKISQTAKSLDRAVPQFIKFSDLIEHRLCARNILLWHMEQWPTQVTCNQPGGMSNLPCEAMAHSHKSSLSGTIYYSGSLSSQFGGIQDSRCTIDSALILPHLEVGRQLIWLKYKGHSVL